MAYTIVSTIRQGRKIERYALTDKSRPDNIEFVTKECAINLCRL